MPWRVDRNGATFKKGWDPNKADKVAQEKWNEFMNAVNQGTHPAQAFIDGYHSGLWLTIGLLAAGVVLSYVTLRPRRQPADRL